MGKEDSRPVKIGDRILLTISSIGKKGDGLGTHEGFVIIVPKAKLDQELYVEIKYVKPNCAFAQIIEE